MEFIDNWRLVLAKAWTVRLMLVTAILSALPIFFELVDASLFGMSPLIFAVLAFAASLLAILARVVQQFAVSGALAEFMKDTSGAVHRRALISVVAVSVAAASAFVAPWEGLRTTAYRDPVGVLTVCIGETKGVKVGDTYTAAECRAMLDVELRAYAAALGKCLHVKVPEGVAVSFLDLTYNVGAGAVCRSTLVKKANAGDLFGACDELPRWNKAGGRELPGLTNRRRAAHDLCISSLEAAGFSRGGAAPAVVGELDACAIWFENLMEAGRSTFGLKARCRVQNTGSRAKDRR
jgi:lysozyme